MQSKAQNYRVVVMGHSGVGKSSIISQFMHRKFTESHKETIEELHRHLVKFESMSVEIDILDTSGSHQFPAMHKLAIATGDAFLLVYSLDKPESFDTVKLLRDEIKELKPKDQFSIVIVANKSDLEKTGSMDLAVHESIVCLDWEEKFVSVSAKDGGNINIVFHELEEKIRERLQLNNKRHGFLRRISMPIMRLAKNERPQGSVIKTKTRTRSVES